MSRKPPGPYGPTGPLFHLFPKLPIELRLMIWELASPTSQVVTITNKGYTKTTKLGKRKIYEHIYQAGASYQIPSFLHTNREAREVAKKQYTYAFADHLGGNGVYFNFETDVLFFNTQLAMVNFYGGTIPGSSTTTEQAYPDNDGFRRDFSDVHNKVELLAMRSPNFDVSYEITSGVLNRFNNLKYLFLDSLHEQYHGIGGRFRDRVRCKRIRGGDGLRGRGRRGI